MALTNTQYEEIMREYELLRSVNRSEHERRRKEVYEHLPAYRDLESRTAEISVNYGKDLLRNGPHSSDDLHRALAELSTERHTLLREAGFPEDYLDPIYTCPDCRDTGYTEDGKCHCFERRIIDRHYQSAGISTLLEDAGFDRLSYDYHEGEDRKRFEGAVREARKFISSIEDDVRGENSPAPNLLLYGTVGTGKTFLSLCIARELLDHGFSVMYYSSVSMFSLLYEYSYDFSKADELHALKNKLYMSELLIIDDLGTEKTNQFITSQLFSCISERLNRNLSTIITTNLSFEDLRETYSDRCFSRITGSYTMCKLTGADIRMKRKLDKLNRK